MPVTKRDFYQEIDHIVVENLKDGAKNSPCKNYRTRLCDIFLFSKLSYDDEAMPLPPPPRPLPLTPAPSSVTPAASTQNATHKKVPSNFYGFFIQTHTDREKTETQMFPL